jgi:ATP-dependent helicase HrpB
VALTRQQLHGADVDRLAPERLWIGGNRKGAPVDYPEEGDPYISARLQDFFGMADGPRIADGRPLVLHLLAPNHRPVQVTTDLRGFWERHYPSVRRELMRRYPRHAWPEDPMDPASIEAARPVPRRT